MLTHLVLSRDGSNIGDNFNDDISTPIPFQWISFYGSYIRQIIVSTDNMQVLTRRQGTIWVYMRMRMQFPQYFRIRWQSPCTTLTADKCLPLGVCKKTVKKFKNVYTLDANHSHKCACGKRSLGPAVLAFNSAYDHKISLRNPPPPFLPHTWYQVSKFCVHNFTWAPTFTSSLVLV